MAALKDFNALFYELDVRFEVVGVADVEGVVVGDEVG